MKSRWKWIVAVAAVTGFFLSSDGVRNFWQRKHHLQKLEEKLEQMRRENTNLASEIHRIKTDPRVMEQYARRELGLIQPGEIEYRFMAQHPASKETQ